MAKYWMSFRIDADAGYQRRYDGMIEAITHHGTGFWDAPTSFIAMESASSIGVIAKSVKEKLAPKDFFMIREITKDSVRYIGKPGDGFDYFFPNAKEV